jgi:hypothetical protein
MVSPHTHVILSALAREVRSRNGKIASTKTHTLEGVPNMMATFLFINLFFLVNIDMMLWSVSSVGVFC